MTDYTEKAREIAESRLCCRETCQTEGFQDAIAAALQAAADDALEQAEKAVIHPDNRLHPDLHCSKEEREEFIEKLNKGDNCYFYGRGQSTATKWQVAAIRALKSQKSHTE